jgi:hypothetical protein
MFTLNQEDNFKTNSKFKSCYNINFFFFLQIIGKMYVIFIELCMIGDSFSHDKGK